MKRLIVVGNVKVLGGKTTLREFTVQTDASEEEFEALLEETKAEKAEMILDKVVEKLFVSGYLFGRTADNCISVYMGRTRSDVSPDTYIEKFYIANPQRVITDSTGSQCSGAIDRLESLLTSCGFTSVGPSFDAKESEPCGSATEGGEN